MQIPNIFTSFSHNFFLTIFLVKSKLSTAKKSKTAAFSRVFTQNNSTIFLGKSKLNFWSKNKDFEHYENETFWVIFNYNVPGLVDKMLDTLAGLESDFRFLFCPCIQRLYMFHQNCRNTIFWKYLLKEQVWKIKLPSGDSRHPSGYFVI